VDWFGIVAGGLAPALIAAATIWFMSRRHPSQPPAIDFLRADQRLSALTIAAILAPWFWLFLLIFLLLITGLSVEHIIRRIRDGTWSTRAEVHIFTAFTIIAMLFLTAMVPVSTPSAPLSWGVSIDDDKVPVWPDTAESSWVEVDGTVISVTHVRSPGAVGRIGASTFVAYLADTTGQDNARLMQIVEQMPGFISAESVNIERTAVDSHEYSGEELRFERREVTFDILGERTAAEVLTVYRPMLGGEVRILTIVEPGTGRFYADPWAENTIEAWMSDGV
jgi:hypothetical protein